jgi:hypothetical protein
VAERRIVGTNDGNVWIGFNLGTGVAARRTGSTSPAATPCCPTGRCWRSRSTLRRRATSQTGYAAVGGFNANTPATPGHVFRSTARRLRVVHVADKSGNLPDIPVDSVIVNPNFPQQVFAGSDSASTTPTTSRPTRRLDAFRRPAARDDLGHADRPRVDDALAVDTRTRRVRLDAAPDSTGAAADGGQRGLRQRDVCRDRGPLRDADVGWESAGGQDHFVCLERERGGHGDDGRERPGHADRRRAHWDRRGVVSVRRQREFRGDDVYAAGSGSGALQVAKASSSTEVTCPASVVYDGSAQAPCTATASGAGGLSQTVAVTYENNVDVGTATASATFDGDDNHTGSSDSRTFAITPAESVTVVTCPASVVYTGGALTPVRRWRRERAG